MTRMRGADAAPAMWWRDRVFTYREFADLSDGWREYLGGNDVGQGTVCGIVGDYSPNSCSLMFALMEAGAILVPLTAAVGPEMPALMELGGVQRLFQFDKDDEWTSESRGSVPQNELVKSFRERGTAGLIVFTSGSTGRPKGILHDCERVMRKFVAVRAAWRTVLFLMMDHFGGFNTLLSTLAYGGVGVCVPERTPEAVCRTIQRSGATLLPTTPTFLNWLLSSGCHLTFDLSTVQLITYGTEVMSETTLEKVRAVFPKAQIKQTYGLSEIGVLRSKSESDCSVWVKVGGDGFETMVRDGVLWVRSEANMVGYLNATSPIDEEGWMCTGDRVEVRGEYVRFQGRESEMINVGGQKVFPTEVEDVLLQADNVREATVYGVRHPMMGQVAHARVTVREPEEPGQLTERLRTFLLNRMAKYKVPVRFTIVGEEEHRGERFKKVRRPAQ